MLRSDRSCLITVDPYEEAVAGDDDDDEGEGEDEDVWENEDDDDGGDGDDNNGEGDDDNDSDDDDEANEEVKNDGERGSCLVVRNGYLMHSESSPAFRVFNEHLPVRRLQTFATNARVAVIFLSPP
jgi:hypothetical protein